MSRWATFDCYGTLIDWNAGIRGELESLFGAERAPALLAEYHRLEPEVQAEAYRSYAEVLTLTLERLAAENDLTIPEGESGVLAHSLPEWPPFREVPGALEELRRRGWNLAILSNTDHALIVESEKRIGVPFDLIVTAEDVNSYKPAHAHWERFFELATADRDRHVHVAASLFHDVAPARELDLNIVWINRLGEEPEPEPDRELTDLSSLPDALDELDAMLELMNAHQLVAFDEADVTADELRSWLTAPSVEVERDIRVLERDGRLIGYADVDSSREDPPLWWCDVKVDPGADADAVVPELVAWLDARAETGRLRVWTSETDARIVGAFTALGFEPVRHSYRMEIDLATDPPPPMWPDGISVRNATTADHRLIHQAVIEVWRDTSDHYDETFEDWAHWNVESPSYDPSLWFLAYAGAELAGFSVCRRHDIDHSAGYVGLLGVRRPWRRQGLGEALLLRSFQAFRERGWTRGTLGVDASSPTVATRLYERAGMRVYRTTVFLERPVRG